MTKAYVLFGGLVLAALTWTHYTGWGPSDVTEAKGGPTTARSTYGGRSWTGAK